MGHWRGSRSIAASRKLYSIQGEGNGGREGREEGARGKLYCVEIWVITTTWEQMSFMHTSSQSGHASATGSGNGVVQLIVGYKGFLDYC